MRDVNVHRAGLTVVIESPCELKQLFAREHAPGLFRQSKQKVEFLGAQFQSPRSEAGFPRSGINRQIAEANRFPVR